MLRTHLLAWPLALAAFVPRPGLGATRLLLEAEDLGHLVRYPDDRPELGGWYAREATCRSYGAPGKACIAAIHHTANTDARTIAKSLDTTLPAGTYRLFVRVTGNAYHDADNILRISLGSASADFNWRKKRRPAWLPGQTIELTAPAQEISMTAVQFGGIGLRVLYECQARSIWVDSIYLTSDLAEEEPPNWAVEQSLRTGRPITEEMLSSDYRLEAPQIEQHKTPAIDRPTEAKVVPLRSFDGRRNLWPNSSLELGLNDGWAATNLPYKYCHVFSERDHDSTTSVHGKYSLRIPAAANPFSRIYELPTGGRMTLSMFLKAQEPSKVTVSLLRMEGRWQKDRGQALLTTSGEVGREWTRVSVMGDVEAGLVCLQIKNPVDLWLDAVQLQEGDLTDYSPRAVLEGSLATADLGNILHASADTTLKLWFHNSGPQSTKASLTYRVVDVRERVVRAASTAPVTVPAGATVSTDLRLRNRTKGLFSALFAVQGREMPEGETVYAVILPPSGKRTRHELASNMDCLPAAYELMKRFGFRWQLYCKITNTAARTALPKPGEYKWPDRNLRMGAEFGMETMPCLWPNRLPDWMVDPVRMRLDRRDVVRVVGRGGKGFPTYPKLDEWREYCQAMADRYKDVIRFWTIDDETEMYYSARDFAPIVRATALGMREADSDVKVCLSCMPEYTEDLLTMVDPKLIGGFGASSYGFLGHWAGRKIRHLQQRYRVPWSCIGVGNNDGRTQMFHTLPGYEPVYWSAARTAREMADLCLNQDAKVIGHYTGRLWNRRGHYNTDYPLMDYDGSPLPHGFSYACVCLNLAEAIPLGDVALGDLGILAYVFELDGRVGACTWATLVPHYDLHWKPTRRRFQNFGIQAERGEVDLLDMYGNPMESVAHQDGYARFGLGEEPVFMIANGLAKDTFVERLRKATADREPVVGRLLFLPGERGRVDLAYVATNHTGAPIDGLRLDARVPRGKLLSKTEWMLPLDPQIDFGTLDAGETKVGRLPTVIDAAAPIENATFQVALTSDGGTSYPVYDTLWLLNAPRQTGAAKPDGDLPEWTDRTPAWIYYTWSWGRFGRDQVQLHENGEHFNYATLLDLRAAIWAAWDEQHLTLAIRVEDDQFVFRKDDQAGEEVTIKLDMDLFRDIGQPANADDYEIVVVPQAKKPTAELRQGDSSQQLEVAGVQQGTEYRMEIRVPWRSLDAYSPTAAQMIGFDLVVTDVDREDGTLTVGKIRWAGDCKHVGQLYLTD